MKQYLYPLAVAALALLPLGRPAAAQTQALAEHPASTLSCGATKTQEMATAADPGMAARQQLQEARLRALAASKDQQKVEPGTYTLVSIPVIFHVFESTQAGNPMSRSISAAQVQRTLDVLNEDFQLQNPDRGNLPFILSHLLGKPNIQFCLATRDPSGTILTEPGIKRFTVPTTPTRTSYEYFPGNNYPMNPGIGVVPWQRDQYVNIYVCNIQGINGGGAVLGAAVFPWAATSDSDGIILDDDVLLNAFTARQKTPTHEIGHYLGLHHIWGPLDTFTCDDSDEVDDTPNRYGYLDFCPVGQQETVGLCYPDENAPSALYMNYMDVTPDACRYMFTKGQVIRMRGFLNPTVPNNRSSLLNSTKGAPVSVSISHNMLSTTLCVYNRTAYRFQAVLTPFCDGLVTYTWTVPNGWTIDDAHAASPLITPNGINGANVTLTVTYAHGTSSPITLPVASLAITVDQNANCFGSLTGPYALCPGQQYQFTATLDPGAVGQWTATPAAMFVTANGTGSSFTAEPVSGASGYGTITLTYPSLPNSPIISQRVQLGVPEPPYLTSNGPDDCPATQQRFYIGNFDPTLTYQVYSSHSVLSAPLGLYTNLPFMSSFRVKGGSGTDGWVYVTATNACGTSAMPAPDYWDTFSLPTCNGPEPIGKALYPNPADEQVSLPEGVVSVQIVDSYGKEVPAIRYQPGKLQVREAAAGLYQVRMTMRDGRVKIQRLQVAH